MHTLEPVLVGELPVHNRCASSSLLPNAVSYSLLHWRHLKPYQNVSLPTWVSPSRQQRLRMRTYDTTSRTLHRFYLKLKANAREKISKCIFAMPLSFKLISNWFHFKERWSQRTRTRERGRISAVPYHPILINESAAKGEGLALSENPIFFACPDPSVPQTRLCSQIFTPSPPRPSSEMSQIWKGIVNWKRGRLRANARASPS